MNKNKNKTLIIVLSTLAAFIVTVSAVVTVTWIFVIPSTKTQGINETIQVVKKSESKSALKVGLLRISSGTNAKQGKEVDNGAELAVAEINEKGLLGNTEIQLIKEDTEGRVDTAQKVTEKVIKEDRVTAIVGPMTSAEMMASGEVAQKAKTPMISPTATNIKATERGDFIFSMAYNDEYQGELLAKHIAKQGKKKVGILFNSKNSYSSNMKDTVKNKLKALKVDTKEEAFAADAGDYTGQLQSIKSFGADALILLEDVVPIMSIGSQARTILGKDIPIYGGEGMSGITKLVKGDDFQNTFYITSFASDVANAKSREFSMNFKQKYKEDASVTAAATYDAIYLIADAYKEVQGGSNKLRDKMSQTHKAYATGDIQFTDKRFVKKQGYIIGIKKEGSLLKEVYQEDII